MMAIVIAPGTSQAHKGLNTTIPTPMMPLVDRPFIQHVIEQLAGRGVTRMAFVLSHLPEKIETLLGDGSRWGTRFNFHLARDPDHPYDLHQMIKTDDATEPVLLVHADRLPKIDLKRAMDDYAGKTVVFCRPAQEPAERWTGWALVRPDFFKALPAEMNEGRLAEHLMSDAAAGGILQEVALCLDARTPADLLESQRLVLDKAFEGLFVSAPEADPGIWISRNVGLHPTCQLQPPVYIGENTRIGAGSSLGPNVVIGRDCILDTGGSVKNANVFPGSYVGEGLELADVLVDRNRLVNVRFGAEVAVTDPFILGALGAGHIRRRITGLLSRLGGAVLLLLLWPLLLLTVMWLKLFRRGPVWHAREAVRLPAAADPALWKTFRQLRLAPFPVASGPPDADGKESSGWRDFFLNFLPGLINVVKGELRLVGVAPRSGEEISAMGEDWRALYLATTAGVVTEAYVLYGNHPSEDELFTTEAFYSVKSGFVYDMKLLVDYLGRLFVGRPGRENGQR